jgi:flagellin
MSTAINTNISALAAQSSLRKTGLAQDTAMERLSTGIRINNAKDDAAGLAISTRMTANIRGISAAIRNANDGISLTQTAEGSLTAIGDNLQRIRELAVQAANSTNTTSDRNALNAEATQLVSEIDRVANNSSFNGIKLLDGSYQNQSLQVGAGNELNDRISISIGSAKSNALGIGTSLSYSKTLSEGNAVTSTALAAGDLSINGFQVAATISDGVSYKNASGSGLAKSVAINSMTAQTGVTATVGATTSAGVASSTPTVAVVANDLKINGVDIGAIAASTNAQDRGTQTAAAINAKTTLTGVTASSNTTTGAVTLTAVDGRNINIAATTNGVAGTGLGVTSANAISQVSANTTESNTVTMSATAMTAGQSVTIAGLTYTSTGGTDQAALKAAFAGLKSGDTGTTAGLTTGTFTGTFTGYKTIAEAGAGAVLFISDSPNTNVGNLTASVSGATAPAITANANTTTATTTTFTSSLAAGQAVTLGGLTFTANTELTSAQIASAFSNLTAGATTGGATALGSYTGTLAGFNTNTVASGSSTVVSIGITAAAAGAPTAVTFTGTSSDYTSKLTLSTNQAVGITLGGSSGLTSTGQTAGYQASISSQGTSVSNINLATAAGAQAALSTLDSAINTITDSRAAMGAYQNRLTASISNLETTSMNLQASRSRILDTDYAKETTNLAKSQIITQAATAMLAQANQSAQSVLALLK